MQKKELSKKLKQADEFFEITDYRSALGLYKLIVVNDSSLPDIDYKIGVCMYHLKPAKMHSLPFFIKASQQGNYESLFYLGNLFHLQQDFDQAIAFFKNYSLAKGYKERTADEVQRAIRKTEYAREMYKHPLEVSIANLGNSINSSFPEYVPLLSADGGTLIFTSRREGSTGNLLDPNGDYFEDIYQSVRTDKKEWSSAIPIPGNVNTATHDACVALSPDGQHLLTYRTSEDMLSGDIYISSFDGKQWGLPVKMDNNINTKDGIEASASFSADNNILFFSSNREGGFGGLDIYRVVKMPDGTWSKPLNLGPVINSEFDEDAPFIHPDNRTLYFSSKAHNNMGGYDIFKSVQNDEGLWSAPENIGYPINTVDDDIYFVLSVNGKSGFYSSNLPNGYGGQDIYEIKFPAEEFDLVVLKADVVMPGTKPGEQSAKATFIDEQTNKIQGIYKTNRSTGKFVAIVPSGKKYKMILEADGYDTYISDVIGSEQHIEMVLKKKE